jgi:hypothetical protein
MAKKIGKVEKPSADKFRKGRKLFFIPLIFAPFKPEPDYMKLISRYWEQVQEQVKNLEGKLTKVKKVYHELITSGGSEGEKAIEQLNTGSHQIVRSVLSNRGAKLQPIEDGDLLAEFMDWSRCLATGLQSQKVFTNVYQYFLEAQQKRNEQIAKYIDKTLKGDQIGLLLMREGHQVQFPSDIQVFYVAPPSLDEIKRWFRERETRPPAKKETEDKNSQV